MIVFDFDIHPQSWQRAGNSGHYYTQTRTADFEDEVKILMRLQMNQDVITTGCSVNLVFSFATKNEKKWGTPKTTRPDNDNYEKALFDAGNGIIWQDDSLIWFNATRKVWAEYDHIRLEVETA